MRRLNRILWLAYQIGGKWGVVILLAALGVLTIIGSILQIKGRIVVEED